MIDSESSSGDIYPPDHSDAYLTSLGGKARV
jgi:hypothetical protein